MNVIPLPVPWLELAIAIALLGALCVGRMRDPLRAWRWGVGSTGATLACTLLASLGYYLGRIYAVEDSWSFQHLLFGREIFGLDELNAPMAPLVALLHFLTALATARTKMRRFAMSWSLASESLRLATFACLAEPWVLIGLLAAGTVPGFVELRNRGRPTRVYLVHMGLYLGLMILGWAGMSWGLGNPFHATWAMVALMTAILIRCGAVPLHCWVTDWFEQASFGNALLFVTPLPGVYAALRLLLPTAPDLVLQCVGVFSLTTAVYAAGMAVVQKDGRRFFAFLFLSHSALVLVGLELHTAISVTGALALWVAAGLSLSGLGLTLRALEARFGRLSLERHHGLYDHSPSLAVCFMVTGLASVGFPGTLGFVAGELLVDGAVQSNLWVGLAIALAAALNGIAVVRVYFLLFAGVRHVSAVPLGVTPREKFAVLTLAALIVGGGLIPQPGIASRFLAATALLHERERRVSPAGQWAAPRTGDETQRLNQAVTAPLRH